MDHTPDRPTSIACIVMGSQPAHKDCKHTAAQTQKPYSLTQRETQWPKANAARGAKRPKPNAAKGTKPTALAMRARESAYKQGKLNFDCSPKPRTGRGCTARSTATTMVAQLYICETTNGNVQCREQSSADTRRPDISKEDTESPLRRPTDMDLWRATSTPAVDGTRARHRLHPQRHPRGTTSEQA